MEPATEDELAFCWRALVDEGKLSIDKLQAFMKDICGVRLSPTQAKDLVTYMDANGDGRVGLDDFRHFMSIGCLADTDPKSFMWAPSAKYRQEHGLTDSQQRQEQASIFDDFEDAFLSLEQQRKSMARSSAVHVAETLSAPPVPTPAVAAPASGLTLPTPPPKGTSPQRLRKGASRSNGNAVAFTDSKSPAKCPRARAATVDEAPALTQKQRPKPLDPQSRGRIDAVLQKYEQAMWKSFLKDEMMYKRQVFERYAGSGKMSLSAQEYHQLIMKWYSYSSDASVSPAVRSVRPADSLATLQYHARREAELKAGAGSEGGQAAAKGSQAPSASSGSPLASASARGQSAPPPGDSGSNSVNDLDLPYEAWLNILAGKHRPIAHLIH